MTDHTAAVIEAQVDWLTASSHSEDGSLKIDAYADVLIEGQEALGNRKAGWRSMGYIGYHCGDVDWGRRDNRQSIIRISGGRADELLGAVFPLADYVSRLDVAVTWRAVPADPHIGENAYSNAEMYLRAHPKASIPSHTGDALGGYTCYLGDRRSPYYGRIYNKEAERASRGDDTLAKRYASCWRYEVECHDSRALALASVLATDADRPDVVQQWVYDFWQQRGVPPAFPPTGKVALVPGFHRRSDDETRLRHLARNVAPTIKRLREHGRYEEAREALGLDSSNLLLTELERLLRQ